MKLEYFLAVENEIKNNKFDFHGNIGTLSAFNSNAYFLKKQLK